MKEIISNLRVHVTSCVFKINIDLISIFIWDLLMSFDKVYLSTGHKFINHNHIFEKSVKNCFLMINNKQYVKRSWARMEYS